MAKIVVYKFRLGDVDDPEIHAASPIYNWQQTEQGRWVMQHSNPEPYWTMGFDHSTYGYRIDIVAQFSDVDTTFFQLKYGHQCK